ncbi:MAG: hypothetical protein HOP15_05605 [Planctomycetes bacterium]|nr:hypothetical protein [Planctomycetota bacterium]
MNVARAALASVLSLALLVAAQGARPSTLAEVFVCPPCGAECHFTTYPKTGNCGVCGMGLVPLASVPQVGVLLYPRVALPTSLLTLSLFAGSNEVRAFCVADTTEPLRLFDTLEVRPQFAFAEAPPLDVLVVPDGFGAWDDPLLVEWVKNAAEHARFVLAVSGGSVVLARAGFLAQERVPGHGYLLRRAKELAPELVFDETIAWRRSGKFFLARDTESALDATLGILQELAGEESAKRTAEEFGRTWKPAAK